jgi:type II secretory pathway component PulF
LNNARDRVTDGTTISGPLAAGKMFPRIMTDMLAVGEQTGDMPGALRHIARRYENELDRNLKIMTTALEPLLIVLVAIVVGFVAISILMAVFNLTNGLDV